VPVKVTLVKCPTCGKPIQGTVDHVFICDCGVAHTRDDSGAHTIKYEVAAPNPQAVSQAEPIFVPVWRIDTNVAILRERSEGGFFNKLFGDNWKGGRVVIFVPAIEWDPQSWKHWSQTLTAKPPQYTVQQGFGARKRMPVVLDVGEAKQLADFIVLTYEAEKPGVLQDIAYEVKVTDATLAYLPFVQLPAGFTLAL